MSITVALVPSETASHLIVVLLNTVKLNSDSRISVPFSSTAEISEAQALLSTELHWFSRIDFASSIL